jgi:hypothetical protein
MDYKPEVLVECRVIEVFPDGIRQRVEVVGYDEPLGKYVTKGSLRTFFIPVQRVIPLPKGATA